MENVGTKDLKTLTILLFLYTQLTLTLHKNKVQLLHCLRYLHYTQNRHYIIDSGYAIYIT